MTDRYLFNSIVIGSTTITEHGIASGTPFFRVYGTDIQKETADGKIHFYRLALHQSASLTAFGNRMVLTTAPNTPATVTLKDGSTALVSFSGHVSCTYYEDNDTTEIVITGSQNR